MKIAIIEGCGPNDIRIPCMVMENLDKALAFVKNALDKKGEERDIYFGEDNEGNERWISGYVFEVNFDKDCRDDGFGESSCKHDGSCYSCPSKIAGEALSRLFFKGYYGGCGECYALCVREVDFGEILVGWDLD